MEILERRARLTDNPRTDFLTVIDAMIFDYKRAKERRVLSYEELNNYYRDTFFSVVNLTLIGFNSRFRAKDIPALSYGQGRVFSVRDLDEDWQRGVINIPKEILEQAQLTQHASVGEVKGSPVVRDWLVHQLLQSREELVTVRTQLQNSGEKITPMLCNGVTKTASQLLRKYKMDSHLTIDHGRWQ